MSAYLDYRLLAAPVCCRKPGSQYVALMGMAGARGHGDRKVLTFCCSKNKIAAGAPLLQAAKSKSRKITEENMSKNNIIGIDGEIRAQKW